MDSNRFDALVRSLGSGASRRSVLKGFLGLGGAAVLADNADARTARTRPTIPPPQTPSCLLPKQMCGGDCCEPGKCKDGHCCANTTDAWCAGKCCPGGLCTTNGQTCCDPGDQVCGNVCCDSAASCARSGNQDICCDPATHYPCGLECCDEEFQCCDGECCPTGSVCLVREVGGESGSVKEELCCPAASACDEECCPDGTPQCCTLAGVSTCIAADACCGECGPCQDCIGAVCIDRCATCQFCEEGDFCQECGGEGGGVCCDGVCERESECCDTPHCLEIYANVDDQCTTCSNGQCQRLGDDTGGPDCNFDGSAGVCCFGQCISAEDRCCAGVGESCEGSRPCCDLLNCDVLANFTCVAPTTTTSAPPPTTTTTSMPPTTTTTTEPTCDSDLIFCNGQCRECCQASDCSQRDDWDAGCVACSLDGQCEAANQLGTCDDAGEMICDNFGQCVSCLPHNHPCDPDDQTDYCCTDANDICDSDSRTCIHQ